MFQHQFHNLHCQSWSHDKELDGNKAKGRISKQVFQENKTCQVFRKANISYLLIRTRTCGYQGVRNVRFFGIIWRALFSRKTRF